MIAGLHWTAWLLIVAAVAPALGLAPAFYAAHQPPRQDSRDMAGYYVAGKRLRDERQILRRPSALIIFSMVALYIAAQLTAAGKAFGSFLEMNYEAGVLLGAAVMLFYTTVGGFKAVAYSDLAQGMLMFGCLLVLPIVGMAAVGGWTSMLAQLGAADPALLRLMGADGLSLYGKITVVVLGLAAVGVAPAGLPATVGVSLFTAPPPKAEMEFESVWAKLGPSLSRPARRRLPLKRPVEVEPRPVDARVQ